MLGCMKIIDVKVYLENFGILDGIMYNNIIKIIKHMLGVNQQVYPYYLKKDLKKVKHVFMLKK